MKRLALPLASVLTFFLVGCSPQGGAPTDSNTIAPPPTVESERPASSHPVPTETPGPSSRGPESPIEVLDAYALCKAQTAGQQNYTLDSWAPFEDAVTLVRDDHVIGVDIEAEDSAGTELAISCKVGGTIGDPEWLEYGVHSRTDRESALEDLRNDAQP